MRSQWIIHSYLKECLFKDYRYYCIGYYFFKELKKELNYLKTTKYMYTLD